MASKDAKVAKPTEEKTKVPSKRAEKLKARGDAPAKPVEAKKPAAKKGKAPVKGQAPRKAHAFRGAKANRKNTPANAAYVPSVASVKSTLKVKKTGLALAKATAEKKKNNPNGGKKVDAKVAAKLAKRAAKYEKLKAAKAAKAPAAGDKKDAKKPAAKKTGPKKVHATVLAREKVKAELRKKGAAKAQALKVEKVATHGKTTLKKSIRVKASFHRPHTLRLVRKPKYARKSVISTNKMDEFRIIKHPLTSETAIKKIEDSNTLVFMCDLRANKRQIAQSIQKLYKVKPERVNTLITPLGEKKAFVRLAKNTDAVDVASSIGIL